MGAYLGESLGDPFDGRCHEGSVCLLDTVCGSSLAVGSVLGVLPEAELATGTSAVAS